MALDPANYPADLIISAPANNEPRAEGASQIRTAKRALYNAFPNVGGEVSADHDRMNEIFNGLFFSPGLIMMWNYSPTDVINPIPDGWYLCDGTTYSTEGGVQYTTPDLRGKFVQCFSVDDPDAGAPEIEEDVGDEGGSNTRILTEYVDADEHELVEEEIPQHSHELRYGTATSGRTNGGDYARVGQGGSDRGIAPRPTEPWGGEEDSTTQPHKHDLSNINDDGEDDWAGDDFRPQYYVLAYVMYIGAGAVAED